MAKHQEILELLAPGGMPPSPARVPPGGRTGDNLWNVYSPRLDRELFLRGDLELDHWVLVESDPGVKWFCEHYPEVRVMVGKRPVVTNFDMLVCYQDDQLELKEVKYAKDMTPIKGSRIWWQFHGQKAYAGIMGIPYHRVTERQIRANPLYLKNWHQILGYLTEQSSAPLTHRVMDLIPTESIRGLGELITMLEDEDPEEVKRATFWLLHEGRLQAPLDKAPLDTRLTFSRRCDD